MRRPSLVFILVTTLSLFGCDQLGNPEQHTTPPTPWKDRYGHLVTTTRSFTGEQTIRRLTSEGIEDLDHADRSIGPDQTLTVVVVIPRALPPTRRGRVQLVTIFKLRGRAPIQRRWMAPTSSDRWRAAFALPSPPVGAVTSVVP